MKKRNLFLTVLLALSLSATAADPALTLKGAGTQTDPYQISSAANVVEIAKACNASTTTNRGYYKGKYFKFTSDIDMSGIEDFYGIATALPGASSSTSTYYFGGIIDGDGHMIKNMTIQGVLFDAAGAAKSNSASGSRANIGFVGVLGTGGAIKNLTIDSTCYISGYTCTGAFVGYANYGTTIENCVNNGYVDSYNTYGGGIVGRAYKSAVTQDDVVIKYCYNAGRVRVGSKQGGGIVGDIAFGTIQYCANVGDVIADTFNSAQKANAATQVGGIAGAVSGTIISDCLNAGTVTVANSECGGIIGNAASKTNAPDGKVTNCINYGTVLGGAAGMRGNIIGMNGSAGGSTYEAVNCVYDSQLLAPVTVGSGSGAGYSRGFVPMSTSQLTSGSAISGYGDEWQFEAGYYPMIKKLANDDAKMHAAMYVSLSAGVSADAYVGEAVGNKNLANLKLAASKSSWITVANNVATAQKTTEFGIDTLFLTCGNVVRPITVCQVQIPFAGSGTDVDPYKIATADDLKKLAELSVGDIPVYFPNTYFKLTADIDMKADTAFHGIACKSVSNAYKYYWFDGIFDGDNHVISNLKLDNVKFNTTGAAATVANGSFSYSGFFGTLGGGAVVKNLILDSTCEVSGYQRTGGIAGFSFDGMKMQNCVCAATVRGYYSECGGLVGYCCGSGIYEDAGVVENCLFAGKLLANYDTAGGITGVLKGKIIGCVNAGTVISDCIAGTPGAATRYKTVGGITGGHYGVIIGSANYGNVKGQQLVGGISGSYNSSYNGGIIEHCLNVGVVTGGEATTIGAISGGPSATSTVAGFTCDYFDSQLVGVKAVNSDSIAGCCGVSTAKLTNGTAIDSIADSFVFKSGYYPVPKVFATNADVLVAAAAFFVLPEDMDAANIKAGTVAPINDAVKFDIALSKDNGFKVENNSLLALALSGDSTDVVNNSLILTYGNFTKEIPLVNIGGTSTGIDNVTAADEAVISVEYVGLNGLRVSSPAPGSVCIAICTTESGRRFAKKVLIK